MAQFVDFDVRQTQPGQWHIRIVLPKETVEAEVRLQGQRSKMNRPQPGLAPCLSAGNGAAYFGVYTYFGRYRQAVRGEWRAHGSGTFTKAFTIPGEGLAFEAAWKTVGKHVPACTSSRDGMLPDSSYPLSEAKGTLMNSCEKLLLKRCGIGRDNACMK